MNGSVKKDKCFNSPKGTGSVVNKLCTITVLWVRKY